MPSVRATKRGSRRRRRRRRRGPRGPLEAYLREINETPLLSADEEKELARRIAQGDPEARDRMIRANLRLVVNIARNYAGKGLPLQDLIEEGNLGLLRAVEGFDPDMNTRFSTYASYWIRQSIKRALINSAKSIRIPAYMVELLSKWRRAEAELAEALHRTPTQEEIARHLGISKKKLEIVRRAMEVYDAISQSEQTEDDGFTLGEVLTDERSRSPDELLAEADVLEKALALLDQLDEREAAIIRMRYGLGNEEPRTLKEIGQMLGLTRERVRQIEHEALQKIARKLGLVDND